MDFWIMILAVIVVAVTLYAMIDVLRTRMVTTRKLIWFAIVVLFPVVGPFLYFIRKEDAVMHG